MYFIDARIAQRLERFVHIEEVPGSNPGACTKVWNNNMKIVFLSPGFYPKVGGVERHVFEIAARLAKLGHEITIITEADKNSKSYSNNKHSSNKSDSEAKISKQPVKSIYPHTYFVNSVRVISFDFGTKSFFKKFNIWKLLLGQLEEFKNADIIHCHDVFIWYIPFKLLLPFKKVFITFHGYESYPLGKKNILIHKISERLTNGNICVGEFIKKWYGTKPDFIIYGGVEVKASSKKITKPSALFYGRLDDQTGILEYLKAAERIKQKIPEFNFDIIGEGPLKNKIGKKFNVSNFMKNPEEKFENYRYAFVSRYLSILEAMMKRKLVVAHFDNPIKKDYLLMSPFRNYIVTANDNKDIAKKILFFSSHRKAEENKIEKAYEWARKQTWENVCKTYLKLWKK